MVADRRIYTQKKDQECQPVYREVRSSYIEQKYFSLSTGTNDFSEVTRSLLSLM